MKVCRQHSYDLVWGAIQRRRLSDNIGTTVVPLMPQCVAQHHGSRRSRLVFADIEITSEYRRHPKRAKEPCTNAPGLGWLSHARRGHYGPDAPVPFQRGKHLVEFLPVEVVRIRKIAVRALGNVLIYRNQP